MRAIGSIGGIITHSPEGARAARMLESRLSP